MSFIGNALSGVNNGQSAGFTAQGLNSGQLNNTYNQNQGAIQQQQQFLQALQGQNGIGNQSSVFNQLQGVANGTGPNPAQAQLAQATGANTANQAALMAGQRGSSQNVGLLARQAAQQGAANQQNAAGQAATMQANQSLNALGQLGGLANQQVAQQQGAVNTLGSQTNAAESNAISSAGSQNAANAGIAGVNAQNASNLTGGLLNGIGSAAMMAAKGGAVGTDGMFAQGGPITNPSYQFADGGPISATGQFLALSGPTSTAVNIPSVANPYAKLGQSSQQKPAQQQQQQGPNELSQAMNSQTPAGAQLNQVGDAGAADLSGSIPASMMAAKGGPVPAMVSPGERYLNPKEVSKVAAGKKAAIKAGEKIPGKAKVGGAKDSYANDTVPKTLQEGGIVLPRHVTQAKDPGKAASDFVRAVLARKH